MLRLILQIIFFILIFRFVANVVMPFLYALFATNSSGNQRRSSYQSGRREGSMRVDYTPPKNQSKHKNDEGEFVDYEEVK